MRLREYPSYTISENNFSFSNYLFVVAQFIAPRTFLSSIDIPLNDSMLNGILYLRIGITLPNTEGTSQLIHKIIFWQNLEVNRIQIQILNHVDQFYRFLRLSDLAAMIRSGIIKVVPCAVLLSVFTIEHSHAGTWRDEFSAVELNLLITEFFDAELPMIDVVGLMAVFEFPGARFDGTISTFSISGSSIPNHNFLDAQLQQTHLTTRWGEFKRF